MRRKEHQKHSPDCPFLAIADPYKLTLREVTNLEIYALECIKVSALESSPPGSKQYYLLPH